MWAAVVMKASLANHVLKYGEENLNTEDSFFLVSVPIDTQEAYTCEEKEYFTEDAEKIIEILKTRNQDWDDNPRPSKMPKI